ncbi:class I SAM-dependent methyltransferase [Candidatus Bipolaricaulota bacterium]|nr:class I SAM-dependent methyltransferase [Candidatus Bipolaricaulota bacterium]
MNASDDTVRAAWETNAEWWDATYKEGNDFHLTLIAPATEELLAIQPGETILDIACGNGVFSRRMASLGANVVAFDFSASFIECAKKRTVEHVDRIEYHVLDATDRQVLLGLGESRFDAAVCTMALMDMEEIGPLAEMLPRLLVPGGRFVFSIMHPCFNQTGCRMTLEEEDRDGGLVVTPAVKVTRYMTPFRSQGIGIRGQPVPQTYFHRPLQELLRPFLTHGLVLDGLKERAFERREEDRPRLTWDQFPEIPPVLVVRLRRI